MNMQKLKNNTLPEKNCLHCYNYKDLEHLTNLLRNKRHVSIIKDYSNKNILMEIL